MHLSYAGQLAVKENRVKSAFQRIGHFSEAVIEKIRPSPRELHYRNKIVLPIAWQKGKKVIGLYAKRSHEVVPVSHCYIHLEEGEKILGTLREKLPSVNHVAIRTAEHSGENLVLLLTEEEKNLEFVAKELSMRHPSIVGVVLGMIAKGTNSLFAESYKTVWGLGYLQEKFAGYVVKVSAPSFFQVNTLQAEALYQAALEGADLQPEDVVLDAYSGIGLLTMMIAKRVQRVMGIEIAPSSISDARENAEVNGFKNIDWFEGLTEEWIRDVPLYEKVFLNPPRGGCASNILETITKSGAKKIVYISCDPATLARDAGHLKLLGWDLEKVEPFDMFPQTMHVESIASFKRASLS
jgi:23S rRNA (uracil1939-C5)-methyltransferase